MYYLTNTYRQRPLLLALLIFCTLFSRAQSRQPDSTRLVLANIVTLHSNVLNQDRKIEIYTPYLHPLDKWPEGPLPVLYLLDGDVLTQVVAAELNYLSATYYNLPAMIVVGIHNYDRNRMYDLTPTVPDGSFGYQHDTTAYGGGDHFLQFLETELIPYIEGHYATDSFRILAGHSIGGLLAFHCLANHPSLFNAYIAISPSLWWDSAHTLRAAEEKWRRTPPKNRFLFYSEANEGGNMRLNIQALDSFLRQQPLAGLQSKYVPYPEESHGTEPIKAMEDALHWLYPDWYPGITDSTASLVTQHYNRLSQKYGYTIHPAEGFVARRGARILASGRVDDALAFFQLNTTNYPASSAAWKQLGDAWTKKGETAKAQECYKKAGQPEARPNP